jgi:hypothetical protein
MLSKLHLLLGIFALYAVPTVGDKYASNQNTVVVDSPQIAASLSDMEGVRFSSPAFLNPSTIPSGWSNGTSGLTLRGVLGM